MSTGRDAMGVALMGKIDHYYVIENICNFNFIIFIPPLGDRLYIVGMIFNPFSTFFLIPLI